MAASAPLSSWILNKKLLCCNWNWTADSGGLCNSQGIINQISGRVVQMWLVTANLASGYAPHSGYGVYLKTGQDFDIMRNYAASVPSSNNLLTRHYNTSSVDFFLVGDSVRLQVNSAGDNRPGKV